MCARNNSHTYSRAKAPLASVHVASVHTSQLYIYLYSLCVVLHVFRLCVESHNVQYIQRVLFDNRTTNFSFLSCNMPFIRTHPSASRIAFELRGNGPDHVLLLPGMCMDREAWTSQVDFLSMHSRFTIILMDNRGVGDSDMQFDDESQPCTINSMAEDAWLVVDKALGSHSRVHIAGHSMGAMIAQRAATMYPNRVRSLALLSGHAGGWWWANVPTFALLCTALHSMLFGHNVNTRAEAALRLHYTDAFLDELVVDDLTAEKHPRRRAYLARYITGTAQEHQRDPHNNVFWTHLNAVRQHYLTHEDAFTLKNAPFSKIVLYGEHDIVVPPHASCELAQRIGASVIKLDAAHFITDEAAHDVNVLLLQNFLANEMQPHSALNLHDVHILEHSDYYPQLELPEEL